MASSPGDKPSAPVVVYRPVASWLQRYRPGYQGGYRGGYKPTPRKQR